MLQVHLSSGLRGGTWACLRPLRGHDEAAVNGTGSVEAIAFLDQLLVEAPGTTGGRGRQVNWRFATAIGCLQPSI
jgi:hypothetical protein